MQAPRRRVGIQPPSRQIGRVQVGEAQVRPRRLCLRAVVFNLG
jgi:hypothetical protein